MTSDPTRDPNTGLRPGDGPLATPSQSLVSLGLPVYNGADYLEPALTSLLAQTHSELELIISDNASTDGTEDICRSAAESDTRIRYSRAPDNRGAAWNYNRVLSLARGPYFKWCAHDDIIAPTMVARCLEVLEREPDIVLCYPRTRFIGPEGELLWEHWLDLDFWHPRPSRRLQHLVQNLGGVLAPVFGLTRTSALRATRAHGDFPSADYVTLAELALLGGFREVPEFLLSIRMHDRTSRAAHPSSADVAEWYKPGSGAHWTRRFYLEYSTVFVEHLRGIARAPLPLWQRIEAAAVFTPTWLKVWRTPVLGEIQGALKQLLGR